MESSRLHVCTDVIFCCFEGDDTSTNIPLVTGGPHDKIANGSRLIEINCTATQGRFLKVSFEKKFQITWLVSNNVISLLIAL